MAKIPAHTLTQPKSVGVPVPEGAFGATVKGVSDILTAAGGVADEFVAIGRDAQKIRNDRDVRQNVRAMRELQADFLRDLQGEEGARPDPSEYVPMWQQRLSEFQKTLGGKGVPAVVTEATTRQFEDFAGKSALEIGALAFKENRRLSTAMFEEDLQTRAELGDFEGAGQTVDEALANGVIDKPTAIRAKRGLRRTELDYTLNVGRMTNPQKLKNDLENGVYTMPEDRRLMEIQKTDTQIKHLERLDLEDINALDEAGLIKSEKDLIDHLDASENITPKGRKQILMSWRSKEPLTAKERKEIRDRITEDYDAFLDGKIDLTEYDRRYAQTGVELESKGKRGGVGEFRSLYYQFNPSIARSKGGMEQLRKAREALLKKPREIAYRTIKERIGTASSLHALDKAPDPDLVEGGERKLLEFESKQEDINTVARDILEKKVDSWLSGLGEEPDAIKIIEYVDRHAGAAFKEATDRTHAERNPTSETSNRKWLEEYIGRGTDDSQVRFKGNTIPAGLPIGIPGTMGGVLPPLYQTDSNFSIE